MKANRGPQARHGILVAFLALHFVVPSVTFSQVPETPATEFAFDSVGIKVVGDYGTTCYTGERYIVVQKPTPDQVDSQFFIRSAAKGRCDADSLSGDIVLRDEWAAYFSGIRSNVLILDSGTGPDIRDLILVDMKSGRHIADLPYVGTAGGPDSVTLGVWEPTQLDELLPGCSPPQGGLLPGVDSLFYVDVRTGNRRFASQTRCAVRQ